MNASYFRALLAASFLSLTSMPGHADTPQLSPDRLDRLDQLGYFTPAFKSAVHDLIDTKEALEQAQADTKKYSGQLPGLLKQSADTRAKANALRKELAGYQHPEDNDFAALQARMKDPSAKPADQLVLAQAFVWAYPSNPHADEARQDLQDIQKKLADQVQAEKSTEAAEAAAQAKLLERVQARDLSLDEWRDFLRDKSQEEVLKYLGRPDVVSGDYWTYKGAYTVDANTGQKVGLIVDFNGTRVNTVTTTVPNAP